MIFFRKSRRNQNQNRFLDNLRIRDRTNWYNGTQWDFRSFCNEEIWDQHHYMTDNPNDFRWIIPTRKSTRNFPRPPTLLRKEIRIFSGKFTIRVTELHKRIIYTRNPIKFYRFFSYGTSIRVPSRTQSHFHNELIYK